MIIIFLTFDLLKFYAFLFYMVFDIQLDYSFIGDDVQNNIKILHEKFGSKFKIKYKDMMVPVVLAMRTFEFSKKNSYFVMTYDVERRETPIFPFQITFFDQHKMKRNNNAFIDNIHKTYTISGTQMIKFVLRLLEKLGVHKASLFDGASVECNKSIKFDLSYLKLIEKGKTFYQKFGFKISLDTAWRRLNIMFDDAENAQHQLERILEIIKQITVNEYIDKYTKVVDIASCAIKDQGYSEVDIVKNSWVDTGMFIKKKNVKDKLLELIEVADNILRVLKETDKVYIYQVLLDAARLKQCENYNNILNGVMHNNILSIKYKNESVTFDYYNYFRSLNALRNRSRYEIILTKQTVYPN